MNESAINFLRDFAAWLWEEAKSAKLDREQAGQEDPSSKSFEAGRALAYYEVMSHLRGQVEVFDLLDALPGLEAIDSDRLLGYGPP